MKAELVRKRTRISDRPLKQITVKIFFPGNKGHRTRIFAAPAGHHFKVGGEQGVLETIAGEIEKQWPFEEYSLKEVGRGCFNFVWVGKKPVEDSELLVGGLQLGETTSVEVGRADG